MTIIGGWQKNISQFIAGQILHFSMATKIGWFLKMGDPQNQSVSIQFLILNKKTMYIYNIYISGNQLIWPGGSNFGWSGGSPILGPTFWFTAKRLIRFNSSSIRHLQMKLTTRRCRSDDGTLSSRCSITWRSWMVNNGIIFWFQWEFRYSMI